jgi:multicomponent Na+:H+ antiporter subunit E
MFDHTITALAGLALLPPRGRHWSFSGLLGFLPFFLVQSLRGGADVARRALHTPPAPGPGQPGD